MLGALIRKIFIVMKVLESTENISTKVQSRRLNQIYSVLTVIFTIVLDAAIIIPWNVISPSVPSGKSFKVPFIGAYGERRREEKIRKESGLSLVLLLSSIPITVTTLPLYLAIACRRGYHCERVPVRL
jgi:hypothetical protein